MHLVTVIELPYVNFLHLAFQAITALSNCVVLWEEYHRLAHQVGSLGAGVREMEGQELCSSLEETCM